MIKVCSLFSGMGGFEFGLYDALGKENVEVVFSSEINSFASIAYETLHNHTPFGDITQIKASDIPNHHLLVAGFPCQAFSIAGQRKGFEDTRGTLFFEVARILKEKLPQHFILENVKGLLSHDKGNTFETIKETLDSLGYTYQYKVLNSKYFNVPQNRERIFIVGSLDKSFSFEFLKQEQKIKKIKDILETKVEENYFLSEERSKFFVEKETDNDIKLHGYLSNVKYDMDARIHNIEGISPTVTTNSGKTKLKVNGRIRKFTPLELTRIQGFSDETYNTLKEKVSKNQIVRMVGNAVSPPVISAIVKELYKDIL